MKKGTHFISLMLLLVALSPVLGMEREIVLGRADAWEDFQSISNLALITGKWGTKDLQLKDNQSAPGVHTDLLLNFDPNPVQDPVRNGGNDNFDQQPFHDSAGSYRIAQADLILSTRTYRYGGGSAGFVNTREGLSLIPGPQAMFSRDRYWGDFTIEFWLYPARLSDGEVIFSWTGSRWWGERVIPQEISCTIEGRKLRWHFKNIFVSKDDHLLVNMTGITPLIPRVWHHHLLRYDSTYALLEYLLDSVPEAIVYTTDTKEESGSIFVPYIGDADSGFLNLGNNFTGFIDELKISKTFETKTLLSRYSARTGTAISRIFDLGHTGTRLKRIEASFNRPGDTEIYFYYRISDTLESRAQLGTPWKQYRAGQELRDVRGRYMQIMVELYPDGTQNQSPEVSELRIVYEPDLPPPPPSQLVARAGNGKVSLHWKHVNEEDVRGYFIYYGNAPGDYHGSDSDLGPSPLDAGNAGAIDLTGLENGSLYYFAVMAYDSASPPHRSLFSGEVSSRPSALAFE